ncbi:transposase [Pseudoscardovia radai]|uniref:transposase n=1 Tax=Pseudoscardovia radai TaxID=987066 RepID=UPI003992837B
MVTITGIVKKALLKPGETRCHWKLSIHVRVSQPVRDYTSVIVNWTERTLVFTNEPSPIRRNATGRQTGIDRGCVHTLALSDGTMLDMPQPSEREKREYLRLQHKLTRQDKTNGQRGGKTAKLRSKRRKLTLKRMGAIRRRVNNRKDDWIAKTTTRLVRDYDLIALEALDIRRMTRRPEPKPDPDHEGRLSATGNA